MCLPFLQTRWRRIFCRFRADGALGESMASKLTPGRKMRRFWNVTCS